MLVLCWVSTLASFNESLSYSCFVCLLGSVTLTRLDCFPIFSGRLEVVPRLDRAVLSIVDSILGGCACGTDSGRVAFCVFSLVIFLSSVLLFDEIY